MTKKCTKCGERKPAEKFYRHPHGAGGRDAKCAACVKAAMAKLYHLRMRDPKWAAAERTRQRARAAVRNAAGLSIPPSAESRARWERKNPLATRARTAANRAVRRGLLISPGKCQRCLRKRPLQKHHPDYRRPLEVEWLCPPCHGLTRRKP